MAEAETKAWDRLTRKRKAFVAAYCKHFNATRAARAWYGTEETSYQGYCHKGFQLVRDPQIAAAIDERMRGAGIEPHVISTELAGIAIGTDIADYEPLLTGKTTLEELRASGVDTRNIRKVKATRRTEGRGEDARPVEDIEIELQDRQAALDKLARAAGMYKDAANVPPVVIVQVDLTLTPPLEAQK